MLLILFMNALSFVSARSSPCLLATLSRPTTLTLENSSPTLTFTDLIHTLTRFPETLSATLIVPPFPHPWSSLTNTVVDCLSVVPGWNPDPGMAVLWHSLFLQFSSYKPWKICEFTLNHDCLLLRTFWFSTVTIRHWTLHTLGSRNVVLQLPSRQTLP
jgi:hypothetical protein